MGAAVPGAGELAFVLGRVKGGPLAEPAVLAGLAPLTRPAREGGGGAGRGGALRPERQTTMLQVYGVVLELVRQLRAPLGVIEHKDRDLARQLRRASASVALNLAEGMYSRGKNRAARYHTALGSARETWACLEVAEAAGYVKAVDPELVRRLDQVVGSLVRLVERAQ